MSINDTYIMYSILRFHFHKPYYLGHHCIVLRNWFFFQNKQLEIRLIINIDISVHLSCLLLFSFKLILWALFWKMYTEKSKYPSIINRIPWPYSIFMFNDSNFLEKSRLHKHVIFFFHRKQLLFYCLV